MTLSSDMGGPTVLVLSDKESAALSALVLDSSQPRLAQVHGESDKFRQLAKEFLKQRKERKGDSMVRFERDEKSERIDLYVYNAQTADLEGHWEKHSPEQLVDGLMSVESITDAPLRSFYVDIVI